MCRLRWLPSLAPTLPKSRRRLFVQRRWSPSTAPGQARSRLAFATVAIRPITSAHISKDGNFPSGPHTRVCHCRYLEYDVYGWRSL